MSSPSPLNGPRALKERGSVPWCEQTLAYLKACMRHVERDWSHAEGVLDELIETRAWEVVPPDKPYGTLNRMLRAEVGLDHRAVKQAIQQAELAAHGANAVLGRKGFQRGDNITSLGRGTSEDYTIRRLRRDHPDLHKRVVEGELSAHKAAIMAGFRKPTATVPIDSPSRALKSLAGRFSLDELREALDELCQR